MSKTIIAVGSTRKPKLNAVTEALHTMATVLVPYGQCEVIGLEVDSGVGHTPVSRVDLMRGARQRADALVTHARENGEDWRFFVGLEGGFDVVIEDGQRRVFLESWAYVTDGERGHFGRSGGVEIPEALAYEVLEKGVELALAIDRFAGRWESARRKAPGECCRAI
jgi:non-canonical (house-cleaning) NTP pyrophosphatase